MLKNFFFFTKMDLHMFFSIKFNVLTFFTVNVDKNAKPNKLYNNIKCKVCFLE